MDDKTLVELCARKDEPAWERFLALHSDGIYASIRRTLSRYGRDPEPDTVEDIFCDVLVSLLEDGGRRLLGYEGRNGSRLSTYLWVIAGRKTVDHLRKGNSYRESLPGDDALVRRSDGRELADAAIERAQSVEAVREAIACLDAQDRLFVRLHYERGLSTDEIASAMGIAPGSVYSRKNRVREKIRGLMRKKSP